MGTLIQDNCDGQFSDAEEESIGEIPIKNLQIVKEEVILNSQDEEDFYEDSDDYDDPDYEFWDEERGSYTGQNPNRQSSANASTKVTKFQPTEKVFKKFAGKINIERYEGPKVSNSALNKVLEQNRRDDRDRLRVKDKADRATIEQVMDPRTRMILFKLLNRGFIFEINGCISTGKEANVYHCTAKDDPDRAIKIYKTSILVFKDRDKYVSGEFRFRQGYGRKNPRKMVRTWAEKEMRNLTRLYNCGIPCPKPILLR